MEDKKSSTKRERVFGQPSHERERVLGQPSHERERVLGQPSHERERVLGQPSHERVLNRELIKGAFKAQTPINNTLDFSQACMSNFFFLYIRNINDYIFVHSKRTGIT